MKLNPDCIRDILIDIEESVSFRIGYEYPNTSTRLKNYTYDVTQYHLRQCELSGFLYESTHDVSGNTYISDLSPIGHTFLADIRSNTIWNKTKNIATKIGVGSLNALTDIAAKVVTELIKNEFL